MVTNEEEMYSVLACQMPDMGNKYTQDWWWKDYSLLVVDTSHNE
jgi:hypothetical protein